MWRCLSGYVYCLPVCVTVCGCVYVAVSIWLCLSGSRFSVYDFINEAQGAEEKDKWRFSVYDFINEAQGAEEKDKWRFGRRGEGQVAGQRLRLH
jgi:hypothetical protein